MNLILILLVLIIVYFLPTIIILTYYISDRIVLGSYTRILNELYLQQRWGLRETRLIKLLANQGRKRISARNCLWILITNCVGGLLIVGWPGVLIEAVNFRKSMAR